MGDLDVIERLRGSRALRAIVRNAGPVRGALVSAYERLSPVPYATFIGWGMATSYARPWEGDAWSTFRAAAAELERFEYSKVYVPLDELLWRHWNVAYAIHHALAHGEVTDVAAVECGVADGMTAHVLLRELEASGRSYRVHLYDSWDAMRESDLVEGEQMKTAWASLSLDRTKQNLASFSETTAYHAGYIPESLDESAPSAVSYLHIDLNAARPTEQALDWFWPRLVSGSVVLFDDYGSTRYAETKDVVDAFFAGRSGSLLPLPTGQAMYFR